MAVKAVRIPSLAQPARVIRGTQIKLALDGKVRAASKLRPAEWSEAHRQALSTIYLSDDRQLRFGAPGWQSCWIGAGEEKAVFLVIDPFNRAFALEVLDRHGYREGRLTEGHYFEEMCVPGLTNARWDIRSVHGHTFSGRVKAREFIYGDTLAGPGLCNPAASKPALLKRVLYRLGRAWANLVIGPRYWKIRHTYRDAHEANVMIELLPLSNPEKKSHYLFPILWLEDDGRLRPKFYRLTPIDVRGGKK